MHESSTTSPVSQVRMSGPQIRLIGLVGLLVFMLGALWYDYLIVRPAVVDAYGRISELNSKFNGLPGNKFMTNLDVQRALQRIPIQTISEGGYYIEVYGWRSGLPIKMHYYYAVYTSGSSKTFLKHFMNGIDMKELRSFPLDTRSTPAGPMASTIDSVDDTRESSGSG